MKKLLRCLFVVITGVIALAWSSALRAEDDVLVVIVNKANPASMLERSDLRPMFQTSKNRWPDGAAVTPLNLPEESSARRGFDAAVLGLDPERVARFWIDRKIRGGAPPPRKLPNAAAVLSIVTSDVGAVGYCMKSEINASVKVVARIQGGQVVAP